MKIKRLLRLVFQISIVMSMLIANTSIAAAGGGKDVYIGQVSNSVSRPLPMPTTMELEKLGISPNATQPLPGGGTATATAILSWTVSRMDGIAKSSLSSDTLSTYYISNTAFARIPLEIPPLPEGKHHILVLRIDTPGVPMCILRGDPTGRILPNSIYGKLVGIEVLPPQ